MNPSHDLLSPADPHHPAGRPSSFPAPPSDKQLAAHLRLRDKQREYEAFLRVCAQAEQLGGFFDQFGDKFDVLSGGTEVVAQVVEHWQDVFRITHLALASLNAKRQPTSPEDDTLVLPPGTLPDKIVRIPVRSADEE